MLLKEAMSSPALFVNAHSTVQDAAHLMREADVGFLPVISEETCLGVLTDRDIVLRVVDPGLNPAETHVAEVMSCGKCHESEQTIADNSRIVTLPEDATTEEAMRLMDECDIHRLAVCDSEKRIVGVVSRKDVTQCCSPATDSVAEELHS